MNSKQLALLVAAAAILGVSVTLLQKSGPDSWNASATRAGGKILDFDLNAVTSVTLQGASGTTKLARKQDVWVVEDRADYPANFERVGTLLRTLWDLKVVQELKVGASQLSRFDLVDPVQGAGVRIEFKDKDGKTLATALLGKQFVKQSEGPMAGMGDFPAGRYVMAAGGSRVALVSEAFTDAEPKPESWLNRDFLHIDPPASVTLKGAAPAQAWKVSRESSTADWKLEGATAAENLDQSKVTPFAGALSSPSFSDVLDAAAKPADTGLDQPSVLTLETFDHFTYTLKIGKPVGDNVHVLVEVSAQLQKERTPGKDEKPEDKTKLDDEFKAKLKPLEDKLAAEKKFEGRPFVMAKFTFDQFLKDRSALFAEAKPDAAPGASATTPPVQIPSLPGAPGLPFALPPASTPPPPPASAAQPKAPQAPKPAKAPDAADKPAQKEEAKPAEKPAAAVPAKP